VTRGVFFIILRSTGEDINMAASVKYGQAV